MYKFLMSKKALHNIPVGKREATLKALNNFHDEVKPESMYISKSRKGIQIDVQFKEG